MKIVLVGYMASGKSAVGRTLAEVLKVNFIDLDAYIETKENLTIPQVFAEKGEIYFRLKETEYLKELLNLDESFVLSLGGGTACYSNNIESVLQNAQSFYLKTSITTLYNRLINEKNSRPLIANIQLEDLKEFIAKHLFERSLYYEQALYSVNTDDKSIEKIVDEIKAKLL